jgi:hypothetical protein
MEPQLTSAVNESHLKASQGKNEYNRHLPMDQQFTLDTTSMLNLTRYQDNRHKSTHNKRPSMEPQFPMMNITHSKNKQEKSSRIFSFSDAENEISVSVIK